MREILFRGKRVDNGEWLQGSLISTDDYRKYILQSRTKAYVPKNTNVLCSCLCYEVDPETVCQYTGLTDKNGKKIFEDDIVKGKFHGYEEKDTITWNERIARFVFPLWDRDEFEVIGNIFDNPDLLTTSSTDSD